MHPRTCLALVLVLPVAAQAQFTFQTQTVLANDLWNNPSSVGVDGSGVMHVAYVQQFDTGPANEVWYAENAGGTWSHVRITSDTRRHEFPTLGLDADGNVHIAFHTNVEGQNKVQYTNNVGGAFAPLIDVTGFGFVNVKLAVDSQGVVHFVFTSQVPAGPDDVYYRTWSPAGGLGPLVNLSNSSSHDEFGPHVAVGPDDVTHVAYQAGGPFGGELVYLNNAGGSFQPLATGVVGNVGQPIPLVSSDGVVSIAYSKCPFCSSSALEIIDDGGTGAFGEPTRLTDPGAFLPAFYERFTIDGAGRRYFAFASNRPPNRGIFFVGETAAGFSPPMPLLLNPSGNQGTSIAVNAAGRLAVTYQTSGFDSTRGVVFADLFAATTSVGSTLPGDLDGDCDVDLSDLSVLLGHFGTASGAGPSDGDIDGDGDVDLADLATLLGNFGSICP